MVGRVPMWEEPTSERVAPITGFKVLDCGNMEREPIEHEQACPSCILSVVLTVTVTGCFKFPP